jgi:predicted DNA-binding protein (MmcQ/YjbR family)
VTPTAAAADCASTAQASDADFMVDQATFGGMSPAELRDYCLSLPGADETFSFGQALRAAHAAVLPGYHLNKRHWNIAIIDGSLPAEVTFSALRRR